MKAIIQFMAVLTMAAIVVLLLMKYFSSIDFSDYMQQKFDVLNQGVNTGVNKITKTITKVLGKPCLSMVFLIDGKQEHIVSDMTIGRSATDTIQLDGNQYMSSGHLKVQRQIYKGGDKWVLRNRGKNKILYYKNHENDEMKDMSNQVELTPDMVIYFTDDRYNITHQLTVQAIDPSQFFKTKEETRDDYTRAYNPNKERMY